MDSLPPIKGFLETSFLDWPKKIAAVIFLPLCNFRCPFCQNLRLIHDPHLLQNISLSHVLKRLEAWKDWIDGVCITGGEPTLHQSLPDFIRLFKERNLLVKVDTNGSNPEILGSLLRDKLIDCIAMDVKAPFRDEVYSRLIGVPVNLKQIRNSIELIRNSKAEPVFRMTVVPGLLAEDDIYEVAEDLRPAKHFTLQQFSPESVIDPELRKVLPWTQEKIDRIQKAVNKILRGE